MRGRKMSALLAILVCIGLIVIDQVSKFLAIVKLAPIENITVIPGILDFTFVKNYGAAFGILQGQRWFFVIITIVILGGILVAFWKLPKQREFDYVRWTLLVLAAGAVGNLIDRFFRGYVVDFFEFTFISYPVFNVADIYVVVGTAILAFLLIFIVKDEKK